MSKNLEIESKSLIEANDYIKLFLAYPKYKCYKQINYYIGSDEFLSKIHDFALRIRKKKIHFELTLKAREKVGKTEINQNISFLKFLIFKFLNKFPNGEVKNFIIANSICDTKKLKLIGSVITYRTDIPYNTSLISIDKSIYNKITDYEVECEDENLKSSENNLKKFLKENEIKYKKSEQGKLTRFLATLK